MENKVINISKHFTSKNISEFEKENLKNVEEIILYIQYLFDKLDEETDEKKINELSKEISSMLNIISDLKNGKTYAFSSVVSNYLESLLSSGEADLFLHK